MATGGSNAPPLWIQSLVKECVADEVQLIMEKVITESDLDRQQNRLLIRKKYVDSIKVMLSQEEKIMANLLPTVGADHHGGLSIRIFTQNKFRVEEVKLQRWGSTGSTVINGGGMNEFRAWSGLKVQDEIEMWGFRDGRDKIKKLCFAIGKTKM